VFPGREKFFGFSLDTKNHFDYIGILVLFQSPLFKEKAMFVNYSEFLRNQMRDLRLKIEKATARDPHGDLRTIILNATFDVENSLRQELAIQERRLLESLGRDH
jgi:hypothetical protein